MPKDRDFDELVARDPVSQKGHSGIWESPEYPATPELRQVTDELRAFYIHRQPLSKDFYKSMEAMTSMLRSPAILAPGVEEQRFEKLETERLKCWGFLVATFHTERMLLDHNDFDQELARTGLALVKDQIQKAINSKRKPGEARSAEIDMKLLEKAEQQFLTT